MHIPMNRGENEDRVFHIKAMLGFPKYAANRPISRFNMPVIACQFSTAAFSNNWIVSTSSSKTIESGSRALIPGDSSP